MHGIFDFRHCSVRKAIGVLCFYPSVFVIEHLSKIIKKHNRRHTEMIFPKCYCDSFNITTSCFYIVNAFLLVTKLWRVYIALKSVIFKMYNCSQLINLHILAKSLQCYKLIFKCYFCLVDVYYEYIIRY